MGTKKSLKDERILQLDYTTDVMLLIAEILTDTINRTIEKESEDVDGPPIPEDILLEKFLTMNLIKFEEECNLTTGPDGKIYLGGSWLMRPVYYRGRMIPMMFFLEEKLDPDKFEMIAEKSGSELRKIMWKDLTVNGYSYDLPRNYKAPDLFNCINLPLEQIISNEKIRKFREMPAFMRKVH